MCVQTVCSYEYKYKHSLKSAAEDFWQVFVCQE